MDGPTPGQSSGMSHPDKVNLLSSNTPPILGPTPGQSSGMSHPANEIPPMLGPTPGQSSGMSHPERLSLVSF